MPDNHTLAALRPDLLRFACLQLRDDALAEDAVQETLIAAMNGLAGEEESFEQVFDTLFKVNGHWSPANKPGNWGDPHAAMEQQQFWIVFDVCLNHLPANTGRVFMMREFLDRGIDEICQDLGISTSNCYVILHRARHQLRGCLEKTWFGQGEK